jgi:hypothetical protein
MPFFEIPMSLRNRFLNAVLDRPGLVAVALCALGLAFACSIPIVAPWWAGEAHLPNVLRSEATEEVADTIRFFASLPPLIGGVFATLMSSDGPPGHAGSEPSIPLAVGCVLLAVAIQYSGVVIG